MLWVSLLPTFRRQTWLNLRYIDGFALEGERRVAGDDERSADARQVRGQALGYTINEIILLGIAAGTCERQHHDGQTRR